MTDQQAAYALIAGIVASVAVLALMPKPRWLDTLWLWMIGVSFVIYVPIWLILKVQDYGALNVSLFLLALFLAGLHYGWPTDSSPPSRGSR